MSERDAALAHAICDAAIRYWLLLEYLLARGLGRSVRALEPGVRGVLLAGAAQLLILERIPPHAAVDESVELARRKVRAGAAGLVNAALRRLAELRGPVRALPHDSGLARRDAVPLPTGQYRLLAEPVLPADEARRLALATSHPPGLLSRWHRAGVDVGRLALHDLVQPPTIVNASAILESAGGALTRGPAWFVDLLSAGLLSPHTQPGHFVFHGTRQALTALLRERTGLWVQDPASSRAVVLATEARSRVRGGLRWPALIVDLCAGRGTKTRQLAAMFPEAQIVATDTDDARRADLVRACAHEPRIVVVSPAGLGQYAARADLVLADVPCTNTGVLARRVEAKYRVSSATVRRLVALQQEILRQACGLLASGEDARVLYATCSLDRRENQAQVDWARVHLGLHCERQEQVTPAGLPGGDPSGYHDGSFAALLRP